MADNARDIIQTLEVLEALYEIYNAYPRDDYIADRVGKISWILSESPGFYEEEGFFELGEGAGDETLSKHYKSVIEEQLKRLRKLREVERQVALKAHNKYVAENKAFSTEGCKVEAYYEHIVDGHVEAGATVVITLSGASKLIVSTAVTAIYSEIVRALTGVPLPSEPTPAEMQPLADALPQTIGEYSLQRKRVVDSADWLSEYNIPTE